MLEMLARGTVLGAFRVLDEIGAGGMGVVYRAEHITLGFPAAIKVLTPEAARSEEVVRRFFNEAQAAAKLKHRHIIKAHDFGQTADGRWYMTLEFLDGGPLSKLIESYAPMELSQIVQLVVQACNALHEAHAHGIVHRDIKPDNLFLTETPQARPGSMDRHLTMLDFGVAKMRAEVAGLQTKSQMVMGTPAYMAPEQLRESRDVDGRADIYSLGVVVYEMSTGVRPWGDVTGMVAVADLQRNSPSVRDPRQAPLPDRARRPELPVAWAQVIVRALDPDRTQRWQTAGELARALATAVPATAWSDDGMDILRKFAPELAVLHAEGKTAGRPLPPSSVPTLLEAPANQLRRPAAGAEQARAPGVATLPLPAGGFLNTLEGSASQLVARPSAGGRNRRWWIAGTVAAASLGAFIVGTLAMRGGDGAAGPHPARGQFDAGHVEPQRAMSALAIVTEPGGATVFVDDTARGTGPLNTVVPVGAEVVVRAELVGHASVTQTVHVASEPSTVRLQLVPLVVDAGVSTPTLVVDEPAPVRDRDRRRAPRDGGRPPKTEPTGSGSASEAVKRSRTFNPDDVPE